MILKYEVSGFPDENVLVQIFFNQFGEKNF